MVYESGWNFMLGKVNIHRTICGGVNPDDTRRSIEDNTVFLHPIHSKSDIYSLAWKDNGLGLEDFSTQLKGHSELFDGCATVHLVY